MLDRTTNAPDRTGKQATADHRNLIGSTPEVSSLHNMVDPPAGTSKSTVVQQSTSKVPCSCLECEKPDTSSMVQCDKCDGWVHYSCVGVDEDIADRSWNCSKCEIAGAYRKGKLKSKKISSSLKTSNAKDRKKTLLVAIVKGGGKKTTSKVVKKSTDNGHAKESADTEACGRGGMSVDKTNDTAQKAKSIVSASSFKSAKARLEVRLKQIEAEETLMAEEMKRKRELVNKKFEVLKELADLEDDGESVDDTPNSHGKVEGWLKDNDRKFVKEKHDSEHDGEDKFEDDASNSEEDVSVDNESNEVSGDESEMGDEEVLEENHGIESFKPGRQSTMKDAASRTSGAGSKSHLQRYKRLTKDELAARQVVPRELPKFSGNPEEWPMFVSTYEDTTEMCGYTEAENMIRLRNCLKGEAFYAVRSFLMRPAMVGKAMNAFKLRLGRP